MEENFIKEKKDDIKERNNEEGKDELNGIIKDISISLQEEIEDFQYDRDKKFNLFLFFIPEGIFSLCYIIVLFYTSFDMLFYLFIFFFPPNLIFNCSFMINKYLYLNNYVLISKFASIENLIVYPILYFIKRGDHKTGDLKFIIIFILGGLSGLFSSLYILIKFYIIQNCKKIKKIYFLYLELIAVIALIHPFLIYTCYMQDVFGGVSIDTSLGIVFEELTIFALELILFIINFVLLCLMETNNGNVQVYKVIMTLLKFIIYLIAEFFLFNFYTAEYLENIKYIFISIRVILMIASLIVSFKIK